MNEPEDMADPVVNIRNVRAPTPADADASSAATPHAQTSFTAPTSTPGLHQPPAVPNPGNRQLRVTRIKPTTTEARIRELFEGFNVESVIIMPGIPGWKPAEAIITMRTRTEAKMAMEDFRIIQEEAGEGIRARMVTVQWA